MKIETVNFGTIEIEEDKVIYFKEGIPGFEDEKEFVIILNEDLDNPFHFLQSKNTGELSFVIVNPFEIFKDYDIEIPETTVKKLKIEKKEDLVIYSIVVVPEDISKMTVNLLGPIVINSREKLGKQVIIEDSRYTTKELIFKEASEKGGK